MDEPVFCENCGGVTDNADATFDEYKENYFCDRECFDEWAADNVEDVSEFYYDLNCG